MGAPPPCRQHAQTRKLRWLPLLLPLAWIWWNARAPRLVEDPALEDESSGPASASRDESTVSRREPPLPSPRFAIEETPSLPPPTLKPAETIAPVDPSPSQKAAVAGEVSNEAIALLDPATVRMLNSHKYWTPNGLVDGLYDAWADRRNQGQDAEDVRQQINWALRGMFMENY